MEINSGKFCGHILTTVYDICDAFMAILVRYLSIIIIII